LPATPPDRGLPPHDPPGFDARHAAERLIEAIGEIAEAAGFFGWSEARFSTFRSEGEKADPDILHRIHG